MADEYARCRRVLELLKVKALALAPADCANPEKAACVVAVRIYRDIATASPETASVSALSESMQAMKDFLDEHKEV